MDAKLHVSVTVPSGGPFSFDIVITNIYGSVLKSTDLEALFEGIVRSGVKQVFSDNQVSISKAKQRGRPRKVDK